MLSLSACATPSLQPFADATIELRETMKQQEAILAAEAEALIKIANEGGITSSPQYQSFNNVYTTFQDNEPATNPALNAAVRYAQAIASISARSENGADAVEGILGAGGRIANVASLGASMPTVDIAVRKPVEALFTAIARIDGQRKLYDIMVDMETASPGDTSITAKFSKAISIIATDRYYTLADSIKRNSKSIISLAYSHSDQWFVGVNGTACLLFYRQHVFNENTPPLPDYVVNPAEFRNNCVPDSSLNIAEHTLRLNLLENKTTQAQIALTQIERFNKFGEDYKNISIQLVNAATSWAAEHRKVYEYLDRCGGFRFLSGECAQLQLPNLTDAISKVQTAIGEAK